MKYEGLNSDIHKLKELLKDSSYCRDVEISENMIYDSFNRKVEWVSVKFKGSSFTHYSVSFSKNFSSEEDFKEFITCIELANKINIMGFNHVKVVADSQYLKYYLDDKKLEGSQLKELFIDDLKKYSEKFLGKLSDLEEKMSKIRTEAINYINISDKSNKNRANIISAKNLVNNFLGQFNLYSNKIKSDSSLRIVFDKSFILDLERIIELIKNENQTELNALMKNFYNAILNGYEIKFLEGPKLMENIYILNKFVDKVNEQISELERIIKSNVKTAIDDNEKMLELIEKINSSSLSEIRQIVNDLEIPELSKRESFKYDENTRYSGYSGRVFKKQVNVNYKLDVFKKLQLIQRKLLTSDEIFALNLYKSQLYRAFNQIIRYQRQTGIEYDENIQKCIDLSWEELKKQNEDYFKSKKTEINVGTPWTREENKKMTIGDKFFNGKYKNGLPSKEEYKNLILEYLPHILSALKKVTLTEDIVVYRGTSGNKELTDCALLSTTLNREIAKDFMETRNNGDGQCKNLYRIIIPKGSPVICFSTELLSGEMSEIPFSDAQKEILIDSSLYDFKSINYISEGQVTFETYIATPKSFDLEEVKQM